MKRLLVFLLCAMLAVPTAGMNVSAAEDSNTVEASEQKEKTPKELAEETAARIEDYYRTRKFTKAEKVKADKVMKWAAKELGYSYENGKFTNQKNPKLKTQEGFEELLERAKSDLEECKESGSSDDSEAGGANSNIILGGKEYDTAVANAGQNCEIAVPVVNMGGSKVTDIVITPVVSEDVLSWPFEIEKTDYAQTCGKLLGESSGKDVLERKHTFRWTLKTREDAVTGYTKLTFNVSYFEADGTMGMTSFDYYVQVNGIAAEDAEGSATVSTPRVIVTGFTTTPEEVFAGDTFQLTLHLKNTSQETAVSNMLFDIQSAEEGSDATNTYAAFLPTAGSSTIYVDAIESNASKDITIELKSKADLAQKPYVVEVHMEYEDKHANSYTDTASVSVPVKQEAKVDISSISVMPESAEVGNEVNTMFSIYNVGKTQLYNVNVKFEADSVSGGDTFIGNLEPGATGNVDVYLSAQAPTADDGTVKVLISYEDEEGNESIIEKTMTLYVSEPYFDEFMEDPMLKEELPEEETGFPWQGAALIGAGAVAAVIIAAVVIRKKKRAKLQQQEELEMIEALEEIEEE